MGEGECFKTALLSILIITSLAAFLLVAIPAKPLKADPEAQVENFLPTDDSHIMEGQPGQVADSGTRYNLYVGWDEPTYLSERIYLKFDLENIPSGSTIDSAVLWTLNHYSPSIGESPYTPKDLTIQACMVEDDDWQESTLTWNNAPPMGTALDSHTITKTDADTWNSWDVTSYVQSEFAGDGIVSIGLKSTGENIDDNVVWFYSKDAEEDQPRVHLRVGWSEGLPPRGVNVELSPDYKDAENGQTVTFNVKITNIGAVMDSYTLENTDTAGWTINISDTVGPLSPGSSENVILSVTIPVDAEDGDDDTITVTATSQENTEVSDSDSCTARARTEVEVREVELTIDPMTKSGKPGGELTYTVTVTNTGDEEDTFGLTADPENADWTANISPASLTLAGGASDTATLIVTTPDDASENDFTTITVNAIGTGYDNSATCTARGAKVETVFPWVYVAVALVILIIIVIAIIVT